MEFVPSVYSEYSLSAVSAVEFSYFFNKEEKFSGKFYSFNNGFSYRYYDAFENVKDAALSRKTCLILTNNKPLKDVFDSDSKQINVGEIAGSCFLKTYGNRYLTALNNKIYVGGIGEKLFITIVPVSNNTVELKIGKNKNIQIEPEYPYTAVITEEQLEGADADRQRFIVDYKEDQIYFKTLTPEGYRFLSYGVDSQIRAVGLELNETIANPYMFLPEFVTSNNLYYNFDAVTNEVKYYNDLSSFKDRTTLNIKASQESDTHLLLSCNTSSIAKTNKACVNIASLKTNFSSSGTYSTK